MPQANAQKIDLDPFKKIKPRSIGPAGMSGRVTTIDVDLSNPERIFIGTASGGVWKSENGGISWEAIFDEQAPASIGALTINQNNPAEIWVGTGKEIHETLIIMEKAYIKVLTEERHGNAWA